jgi:hypothetical protein
MKFVYDGDYAVRDGVTFMFGNPTTVENKGTIQRLLKDPQFRRCDEEKAETTSEAKVLNACPKCGETFTRGLTMHVRYCKA